MEKLLGYWDQLTVLSPPLFNHLFIPFLAHQVLFWSYSLLLLIVDLAQPAALYKYKIQKWSLEYTKLKECIGRVLFNQYFIMLPFQFCMIPIYTIRLSKISSADLPSSLMILRDFVAFIVIEEIGFYYSHRFLHHPKIYSSIHKIHHEFRAPIGMSSEYAHALEFLFSNIIPLQLGPILMGSHLMVTLCWYSLALISTITHHSGYLFPWTRLSLDPTFHDFHHYSFNSNFGVLGWLDKVHGTWGTYSDQYWKERNERTTQKKRN